MSDNLIADIDSEDDTILGISDEPIDVRITPISSYIATPYNTNTYNTYSANTSFQKYHRLAEVHDVPGFVVNIHDATNFDIDLDLPAAGHELYQRVIKNEYSYKDLPADFLLKPNIVDVTSYVIKRNSSYRCRLRGIGINQNPIRNHRWLMNQICVEVKQLIDRSDAWVTCTLSDIDIYRRLLIDIVIHTKVGSVDLCEYLLSKVNADNVPLFYPYANKRIYPTFNGLSSRAN